MQKKIKCSFKKKLFWYVAPLILFLSLLFAGIFIQQQNKLLKENLVDRGLSLVANLALASELGVFSENKVFIEPAIKGVWAEKDVVYIFIYKSNGEILSRYLRTRLNEELPSEVKEKIYDIRKPFWQSVFYPSGEKIYEFYAPVISIIEQPIENSLLEKDEEIKKLKGKIIGISRIGISLLNINKQQKRVIKLSITVSYIITINRWRGI